MFSVNFVTMGFSFTFDWLKFDLFKGVMGSLFLEFLYIQKYLSVVALIPGSFTGNKILGSQYLS